ncbi:MAG: restriction endonuclease subunit S, partial [Desulfobacterales bacterium]|nr:restriction endonuclease subunit S [Desulfobacterales bacterium]
QWEIPFNWKWTQISELGKIVAGGTPSTKESSYWGDEINWITPADLSGYNDKFISKGAKSISKRGLEKSSAQLMPSGSIHFSSRAPIGYVVISKEEISTNQGFKSLVPANKIFNEYVYYYFKSAKQLAEKRASGTTFKEISKKSFSLLPIPIAPYSEQRAIVSKIEQLFSDLDNGIDNFKKAQAQLKLYRQSVLKAACEGKLVPNEAELAKAEGRDYEAADVLLARILEERREKWESKQLVELIVKDKNPKNDSWKMKYKEPSLLENDDLPSLPEGWIYTNFEQIADGTPNSLKAGPFGSALKKDFYVPNGYKIYGQEQVIRGDPFYGDYYIDEKHYEKLKSCAIKPGDILISLVGTVGKVLILPFGIEPGIINPRLVKLSLDRRVVNYTYIKAYLESPNVRHYFSLVSHGGTMDILNLTVLKELPIPLPPFKEQNVIVSEVERCLSISDKMEETITESLQKAEALRQSILKKAFEGKLLNEKELEEARNAPDWEPAEKLLERIKAEKTNIKANNKDKK